MTEFRHLNPGDVATYNKIITASDAILQISLARAARMAPCAVERAAKIGGDWFGTKGLCMESSDAVTRASHGLGIVASRESLAGWHYITSFAPLGQLPAWDDLILCRTWGQFDTGLYLGTADCARQPFFGTREQFVQMLPEARLIFAPDSVVYRQTVHAPTEAEPEGRHVWLCTRAEEVATGQFPIGEVASIGAYKDRGWL